MSTLKYHFFRIRFVLISLVLLFGTLPLVVRAAMQQVDQGSGEQGFLLSSSNTGMAVTRVYLPIVRRSETIACGEITTDATWMTTASPYRVTCDVIVPVGVTLSIEEGVNVLFEHPDDDLIISGTLQVAGAEDAPIYFQPLMDTTPGSWGRIAFMPGSSGKLDHAILEYGGSSVGIVYIASEEVQVLNSIVQYSANTGIYIQASSPLISGSQIMSNVSSHSGGGLYNDTGSPLIQKNIFSNNSVSAYEDCFGGGLYNGSGNPTIQNNIFTGNVATGHWVGNTSYDGYGGGLYNGSGNPTIQNNTFTGNMAQGDEGFLGGYGGGLYNANGSPTIRSNIVVNNTSGGGIYNAPPTLDYNDVWNNSGGNYNGSAPGTHDISADPLLVDPANGDFHLASGSPCIDAGDPVHYPATDFEGDPRPNQAAPDIGADEYRAFRVTKIGTPDEASPGSTMTYTVMLTNLEPLPITNVLLTDTMPVETAFTGYLADELTCTHDGSTWGGLLSCTLDSVSLAPGESRTLTVTVILTETFLKHQFVTNPVTVTASAGGETYIASDQARTWVTWCTVQVNDTPMGSDLQAAIDASTQPSDVVKVSGECRVHDLNLNKTLILQGGWSQDFSQWDPAVITTILDGQDLGRVIEVEGNVNPTIEGFIITGGNGVSGGGIYISSGSPTIQNNIFSGNSATYSGGGLFTDSGRPIIQNNTFSGNSADPVDGQGGGLHNNTGSPTIQNNTFTGNSAGYGGGLYNNVGNPIIRSNILVSSTAGGGIFYDLAPSTLDYNDVWNNTGGNYIGVIPGTHDISADPLLVDPVSGDFHISPGSPCIDAGDPDSYLKADFEGDPRPMGAVPDIGADEFRSLGVTIIGTPDEASPGGTVSYAVTLVNLETVTLTNMLLTDPMPVETAFTSYQADGMTCTHDGSAWGGQLSCTLDSVYLAPGESHTLTLTVKLTDTIPTYIYVVNPVTVTASHGGETFISHDQVLTWVSSCAVQLNDTPMGRDLQAAVDFSLQPTDVVKVSGYCRVHDLNLNKSLILQGGWSLDFSQRDPAVVTTTLDGQSLGQVILVEGNVNPTIEGFIIMGGKGNPGGGISISSGSPIIQNNIITGNQNNQYFAIGGGLYNGSGSPTIQNNTFTGNETNFGGGLYNQSGNPIIQNNTFSGNLALSGGGLYIYDGSPNIRSNIVVSNQSDGIVGNSDATPTLDYNDVWNNSGDNYSGVTPGPHDINADPLLVDPANGDFHLASGSPCIDAGDPVHYPATDFEGDPRPQGLAPDIGADEFMGPLTFSWRIFVWRASSRSIRLPDSLIPFVQVLW